MVSESCQIKFQFFGDGKDFFVIDSIVIFQQCLVKFPEFPLIMGRQSCHGGLEGEPMTGERELFDHHFDLIWIFFQHLLDERFEPRTIGSLVIIEHNQGDFGILGASKRSVGDVDVVDPVVLENA